MLLKIGDGRDWHFINGAWRDGIDGGLEVPEELLFNDGPAMQGAHYAFHAGGPVYRDCAVHFEFMLQPHTDIGIALRAEDETNFHLLHFPCCGQACRAQHFWAALSRMDQHGHLRVLKREMIRRVPSNVGRWLSATLELQGSTLCARIGDYGYFEARLDTPTDAAGHLGLFAYGPAKIRNVDVQGQPLPTPIWRSAPRQPTVWSHPIPAEKGVWQQPADVKRLPDGQLLLLFNMKRDNSQSEDSRAVPMLSRSRDNGITWSNPEPLSVAAETSAWIGVRLHVTPRGRLIVLLQDKPGGAISESTDGGVTWTKPVTTNLPLADLMLPPHAMMNLADGGILAFPYGRFGQPISENLWTWGSLHCQAFCCRSDDDGRTWSAPVNLDTPMLDAQGNKIQGNLDLTETSAVQHSSGRVMAFVRPVYSPWMWETWSDDGGRSWGPCVRGPFPGYAAPNMLRTASGALLIAHRLPELTIHCSRDKGVTWDEGTIIDTAIWAMGSMIEVEPDVVLYVYWDSYSGLMRSQRFRVTPQRLIPEPKGLLFSGAGR